MIYVKCIDDGALYGFCTNTPYRAMEYLLYTLNIKENDENAKINKTESGLHLWMEHRGKTYAVKM